MSEARSPLFNRTYLKAIAWIVAIVIVLLTAGENRSTDFISIKKLPDTSLYYVNQDKAAYLQLRFLLRTGAAINGDQQLLQKLLLQQIQQQLTGLPERPLFRRLDTTLTTEAAADHITIALTLPASHSEEHAAIGEIAATLLQQLSHYQRDSDLEKHWELLEAEQYLNLKDPESRLLNHFTNQISGPVSIHPLQRFADLYHNSTRPAAITLTIQGPDAEHLAEALTEPLKTLLSAAPRNTLSASVALPPGPQRLQPQNNQTYILWGVALPGRQQEHFATELLAVRTLQQLLQQQDLAASRLIWKSLDKQGYLAMILQGSQITPATDLTQQLNELQAQLSDELIDNTRTALQTRFDTQMAQTDNQLALLDSVAFYQLPTDYISSFDTSLNQVENDQVREMISRFFNGSQSYQITLPAY